MCVARPGAGPQRRRACVGKPASRRLCEGGEEEERCVNSARAGRTSRRRRCDVVFEKRVIYFDGCQMGDMEMLASEKSSR